MTLSEFILENMEAVLKEWETYAKSIPAGASMDTKTLRDEAEEILRAIAHDMAQAQTDEEQEAKSKGKGPRTEQLTAAADHAIGRQSEGFSLNEMVSEYRALRASVLRLWTRSMSSADTERLYDMTRFNESLDQALTESVAHYSQQVDRSRELFLGVLGHDLRSPLGAVLNSAEYLLRSAERFTGTQTKAVSVILRSGKHLHEMISDLLDVARTRLGESLPIAPRQVDLALVCEGVVDEARAFHPDHVVTFSSADELDGTWDEARVAQMLSNLVENAIRHGAPASPVTVSAGSEATHVTVSVHNEGRPIPESARRRIFEPMTREENPARHKKAGGLGLGLYIARVIAQAHGGSIDVASSSDKGTTFTVRLPRKGQSKPIT